MCHGQLLDEAMRRARKAHRCYECGGDIDAGERYYEQVYLENRGDRPERTRYHIRCAGMLLEVAHETDGCFAIGDARETLAEKSKFDGWKAARKWVRECAEALKKRFEK